MISSMTRRLLATALAGVMLLAACGDDEDEPSPGEPAGSTVPGDAELANPAAVYCEDQGGTYGLDDDACTLPDGSVVNAWDYFRENAPTTTAPDVGGGY